MTWSWGLGLIDIRDFKIQQLDGSKNFKKKKNNRVNKRNKNFAHASHFFVHFFAVFIQCETD